MVSSMSLQSVMMMRSCRMSSSSSAFPMARFIRHAMHTQMCNAKTKGDTSVYAIVSCTVACLERLPYHVP